MVITRAVRFETQQEPHDRHGDQYAEEDAHEDNIRKLRFQGGLRGDWVDNSITRAKTIAM